MAITFLSLTRVYDGGHKRSLLTLILRRVVGGTGIHGTIATRHHARLCVCVGGGGYVVLMYRGHVCVHCR